MITPTKSQIIAIIIIIVLIFTSGFFALKWYSGAQEIRALNERNSENKKIVSFIYLFIDNIFGEGQEVSFEARLKMENAVRDINKEDILNQWEKFTASKTQEESQANAKSLFDLLIKNLK